MPVMLKELEELKKKSLDFTKKIKSLNYLDPVILKNAEIDNIAGKVAGERFKIALVSTFSAGKSTFINALLGAEILSMDELAWTATVTKIVYSDNIYITVKYNDNRKDETFSGTYKGQKLTPGNIKLIREILDEKTTVMGRGKEQKVKEVIIGYPFELCKNGIEFIDTPGLGATHENHDQITNSILPDVQAVIFLFPPTGINDKALVYKIKDYIKSAKESKLHSTGDHIFFVMNKSDTISQRELPRLLQEINHMVEDSIPKSNPLPVSALYAMKARSYRNGYITLESIQKFQPTISIPDPLEPEYTVSGRYLKEEHIDPMLVYSKIHTVESTIGKYLENKGDVFIYRLKEALDFTLSKNLTQVEERIHSLRNTSKVDTKDHNDKIKNIQDSIANLELEALEDLNYLILTGITGTDSNSIVSKLELFTNKNINSISEKTIITIRSRWNSSKSVIYSEDSALSSVTEILNSAPDIFNNNVVAFSNEVFSTIKEELINLIKNMQTKYEGFTKKISTEAEKGTSKKVNFDTEHMFQLLSSFVHDTMDKMFKNTISSTNKSELKSLAQNSYITVKIPGVVNSIKRGFGGFLKAIGVETKIGEASYKEEFSTNVFISAMDSFFNKFFQELKDSNRGKNLQFHNEMINTLKTIQNEFLIQNKKVIENEVQILQNLLKKLIIDHNQSEADMAKEIQKLNLDKNNIMGLKFELDTTIPKKKEVS